MVARKGATDIESLEKAQEDMPKKDLLDFGNIPRRIRGSGGDYSSNLFYNAVMALIEMKRSSCAIKEEEKEEDAVVKKQNKKNRKRRHECGINEEDHDWDKKKKPKQSKRKLVRPSPVPKLVKPSPAPPLSTAMSNYIRVELGGIENDPELVIMKKLTNTDLETHQGRLSMPKNQVRSMGFLTAEEENILSVKNSKVKFTLIQPCLEQTELILTWWYVGSSKSFMLNGSWNEIISDKGKMKNGLAVGVVVQVWGFRSHGKLFMALVTVKDGEGGSTDIASTSTQDDIASTDFAGSSY